MHRIHVFFYIGLGLMLGAIRDCPGPVIGIPLAFHFSPQWLGTLSQVLMKMLPWMLAIPPNNSLQPSAAHRP